MINERLLHAGRYAEYYELLDDAELAKHTGASSDEAFKALVAEKKRRAVAVEKANEQEKARKEQEQLERAQRLTKLRDVLPYSDSLATEICERVGAGGLLSTILADEYLPTRRRCNQWLREQPDFRALYEQSLQERYAVFEDDLVSIPDAAARDFDVVTTKGVTRRFLDPAKITAAKLRVEVRRLHLIAGRPSKWGSSTTIVTKSEDGLDVAGLSADALEEEIQNYERKSKIARVA